ncbi:DUF1080 domain-containing protein [Planctomycetales bacterium ZRK34]|nr:DUF1080 domain-containing protein [Planctomycetales bacterium ZRK34]
MVIVALSLLVVCLPVQAAEKKFRAWTDPADAAHNPDFKVQGEYKGDGVGYQVIALHKGRFTVVKCEGGLPGDGFNGKKQETADIDAAKVREIVGSAKHVVRESPTLGAKAPEGAMVLFDGTFAPFQAHWRDDNRMTAGGLLCEGALTKDTFGSFTLHLEFRLPYMPEARGQARGNSGLYMQGRYELQMLDSFGLAGMDNECGGIYKISRPAVNMCYPPLSWQTYDIDLTAAKFDSSGKKIADTVVTIRHNGVVIHDHLALPGPTPGGVNNNEQAPGPIFLQNHGNPVRYRNIWITKKD